MCFCAVTWVKPRFIYSLHILVIMLNCCVVLLIALYFLSLVHGVQPDMTRDGCSIPVTLALQNAMQKNIVLLPIGACDDGAHSQNEKINSVNYVQGVIFARLLLMKTILTMLPHVGREIVSQHISWGKCSLLRWYSLIRAMHDDFQIAESKWKCNSLFSSFSFVD